MSRDINRSMYDYLPNFYEDIREARAIIDAGSSTVSGLTTDINDVIAQFYVDTATWGLAIWERGVGLPSAATYSVWETMSQRSVLLDSLEYKTWDLIERSYTLSLDERRSAVKSRLRGAGTVTKELLKSVCASYTGGAVEIIEIPVDFRIQIEFIDIAGVPVTMDALESVVRDIVPAHLEIEYVYRYLRWNELDSYVWTWNTLDAKGYSWDAFSSAIQ